MNLETQLRIEAWLNRVGLQPLRKPPFVNRLRRFHPDRASARLLGPELMVSTSWRPDPEAPLPDGELASVFLATRGLHKWLHYLPIYEKTLSPLRGKDIRFLEIGVASGGSLSAWGQYFGPQATIVGIDVDPACGRYEDAARRRFVRIGKQQDPAFLHSLVAEFGPFDAIVDDGSHRASHMIDSFRHLFVSGLVPGGAYIVEDVHTNYWRKFRDRRRSFVDVVGAIIDLMHAHYTQGHGNFASRNDREPNTFDVPLITTIVDSVEFHDSIVVIRKAVGMRPVPSAVFTGDPQLP